MVLSLLYGKKYPKSKVTSSFGGITFDTVTIEDHKYTATATQYPVQVGRGQIIISDHILKAPEVVNISGIVSDTPLNILASFNRSTAAFNQLVEIFNRRVPVTLVTGIKVYTNMAIVSLNVPRNIKTGQTLTFNLQFQKIIFDDTIQIELNAGNVFEGVQTNVPREVIKDTSGIPALKNDPVFSLKDQAQSTVSVGVQSLAPIPASISSQVFQTALILSRIS